MLGDEGGKGNKRSLTASTASLSTPAKTVIKWSGLFALSKLILAPGRAFRAAQPQTEFITTRVVPSFFKESCTSCAVYNSSKPTEASSKRMGFTNSSGYIILNFNKRSEEHTSELQSRLHFV